MKTLAITLALMTVASLYSVPSYAKPAGEPPAVSDSVLPPECADPATKQAHPGWYTDGGYCVTPMNGTQPGTGNPNVS